MKLHTTFLSLLIGTLIVLFSCNSTTEENTESVTDTEEDKDNQTFYEKGREISKAMQGVLLSNVSSAIQVGGTSHAVEFCNTRALPLTDSISQKYDVRISRVSDKNRNPANAANESELKLIEAMKLNGIKDTVINMESGSVYYSTIKTGMPACIKCHGNSESDIEANTLKMIDSLYPNDKAKNYSLGDFRGLWKIQFQQ